MIRKRLVGFQRPNNQLVDLCFFLPLWKDRRWLFPLSILHSIEPRPSAFNNGDDGAMDGNSNQPIGMQVSVKQVEASAVFAVAARFHRQIRQQADLSGTHQNGRSRHVQYPQDEGRAVRRLWLRATLASDAGAKRGSRLRQSGLVGQALLVRNAVDDADRRRATRASLKARKPLLQ